MEVPHHLTYHLKNVYAGQKATIRTGLGIIDWYKIGERVCQGGILSHCFFNFYAEYTMGNVGLGEAQAGIKISRRNINDLRNADKMTVMAESEEELKTLSMRVKEETEKTDLNINI